MLYDEGVFSNRSFMSSDFRIKMKGHEVIFDSEEVFKFILSLRKRVWRNRLGMWVDDSYSTPYAMMNYENKNCRIHHILVGHPLKGYVIDHMNRNSLDNRLANLRVVKRCYNSYNRDREHKFPRWVSKTRNGKYQSYFRLCLGTFSTPEEAHQKAYEFTKKYHPELIIPEGGKNE